MRYFNRIIIIINTALFLVVGAFGISISINDTASKWSRGLIENLAVYLSSSIAARIIVLVFSIFLIFIALFTIFGNLETRRQERTVVLESPLGDIMVSLSAIEDFSKVIKNQIDGVKDIKGKVYAKRKRMDVRAKVVLYSDRSVAEVTQEVQEAIINYIKYTLGIEAEIKPTIIVSKVAYKSKEEK